MRGVVYLVSNPRRAGLAQGLIARYSSRPAVFWNRQTVAPEKRRKSCDVPRLGVSNIDEWPRSVEVRDHLVIDRPGAVLVIERLTQRANLGFAEGQTVNELTDHFHGFGHTGLFLDRA